MHAYGTLLVRGLAAEMAGRGADLAQSPLFQTIVERQLAHLNLAPMPDDDTSARTLQQNGEWRPLNRSPRGQAGTVGMACDLSLSVSRPSTAEPLRLTTRERTPEYDISSDGHWLAVIDHVLIGSGTPNRQKNTGLIRLDLAGSPPCLLAVDDTIDLLRISPDGSRLAFYHGDDPAGVAS